MPLPPFTFVGVDPTAGQYPFTFAALDQDGRLVALAAGEAEEVVAFLTSQPAAMVAINAPPHPNHGLLRQRLEGQNLSAGHLRGSDMRLAEHALRECGIVVSPTPCRLASCSAWMQSGFDFYHRLDEVGFKPYPTENASHQWLETHPHAAFCAMLGQLPLPKPTLEGRLQRQIVLHEQNIGLKDPMEFFEEITRHRLRQGVLPMEYIYTAEQLDTLAAAYVAYGVVNYPQEVIMVGDQQEGQITLPIATLKEKYS